MRTYELVTIFRAEEELYQQGREATGAELKSNGAEILKEEEMGDRSLAYPIKDQPRGRYILYNVKLDPEKILGIEKTFKLNTNLLKHLFVRVED